MKRRIASLWFPRLATDRLIRRGGLPAGRPLATVVETGNRVLLAGIDRAASAAGLGPGMTLADARAMVSHLLVRPADPRGDAALLARLGRWCMRRHTPLVATDGADGLLLDITGCAHLFGGEAALLGDLVKRLGGFGFAVSGALADTIGGAWALARFGRPGAIAPPGATARALERLPVASLRLDRETAAGLAHLGLRRVGDLYGLSRASLTARYGIETLARLDRALGRVAEPLHTLREAKARRVGLTFADAIGTRADIDAALDRLLGRLGERLERAASGVRRLALVFRRVDGTQQTIEIGTVRPLRDPAALARLFRDRLDGVEPGFGIEEMVLTAAATAPLDPAQARLDEAREGAAADGLAALVERLGNRYGFATVRAPVAVDSHLPDRAWRSVPVAAGGDDRGPWPSGPPRPLRLFAEPEPVETTGGEHGPPDSFRWRGRRHGVRAARGPERIAPEWWREDAAWASGARDYWRIEDETGRRFWLCRVGQPPHWRLHGLFA